MKTYELYLKYENLIDKLWAKAPLYIRDELRNELYDWLKYTGESDGPITDERVTEKAGAVLHELCAERNKAMARAIRYEIYRELVDRKKP